MRRVYVVYTPCIHRVYPGVYPGIRRVYLVTRNSLLPSGRINTQPAWGGLKCSELYVLGIRPTTADHVFVSRDLSLEHSMA
jgi:hypothetical protein